VKSTGKLIRVRARFHGQDGQIIRFRLFEDSFAVGRAALA